MIFSFLSTNSELKEGNEDGEEACSESGTQGLIFRSAEAEEVRMLDIEKIMEEIRAEAAKREPYAEEQAFEQVSGVERRKAERLVSFSRKCGCRKDRMRESACRNGLR